MEDILFSQKQYKALVDRLEEIINGVTFIKLKEVPETTFIDNDDLLKLLMVTNRTIQRWRKSGRLPFIRIGKKLYYRLEDILRNFTIRPGSLPDYVINGNKVDTDNDDYEDIRCKHCPLMSIFKM